MENNDKTKGEELSYVNARDECVIERNAEICRHHVLNEGWLEHLQSPTLHGQERQKKRNTVAC